MQQVTKHRNTPKCPINSNSNIAHHSNNYNRAWTRHAVYHYHDNYQICLYRCFFVCLFMLSERFSLRRQRSLCKSPRPKHWPATRADAERVTRAEPAAELAQVPSPALWPATRAVAERVSVPPPPVQEGHKKWLCVRPGPVCNAAPGSEEAPTNVLFTL